MAVAHFPLRRLSRPGSAYSPPSPLRTHGHECSSPRGASEGTRLTHRTLRGPAVYLHVHTARFIRWKQYLAGKGVASFLKDLLK